MPTARRATARRITARRVTGRRVGVSADPLKSLISTLYGDGEQGGFFVSRPVVSGQQVLFQDEAGTVPVTADGDPVGRWVDLSGNGKHATQSVSGARPVYRTDGTLHWLEFDGVSQHLLTASVTAGGDKVQVFCGITKLSDSPLGVVVNHNSTGNSSFRLSAPEGSGAYRATSRGTSPVDVAIAAPAPTTDVLTMQSDIRASLISLRRNGAAAIENTADQGDADYATSALGIGSRSTGADLHFNGEIYGLAVRFGPNLSPNTIVSAEEYIAALTGVTL